LYDTDISEEVSFKQSNREKSLQKLMRVNLLKRLESSVESFRITLNKFINNVKDRIESIENFEKNGQEFSVESLQIDNLDTNVEK